MDFAHHIVFDYAPGSAYPESAGTVTIVHRGQSRYPDRLWPSGPLAPWPSGRTCLLHLVGEDRTCRKARNKNAIMHGAR